MKARRTDRPMYLTGTQVTKGLKAVELLACQSLCRRATDRLLTFQSGQRCRWNYNGYRPLTRHTGYLVSSFVELKRFSLKVKNIANIQIYCLEKTRSTATCREYSSPINKCNRIQLRRTKN